MATALALQLTASVSAAAVLQPGAPASSVAPGPVAVRAAPAPVDEGLVRLAGVHDLLAARSRAVLERDRRAFLATVDPRAREFRQAQADLFDALAEVPLTAWSYVLDAADVQPADPALDARYGTWWAPRVTLRHALRGIDVQPAEAPQHLTFVRRGAQWYVAADSDFAARGDVTARALWDSGPVVAVQGRRSLVLGHPRSRGELRRLAREVDAAVPRVSAVWGSAWSEQVAVLVPADQRELEGLVSTGGDLGPIAALAVSGPVRGGTQRGGDRVLVNPPNLARLGELGRRVVLTHEVTHVAARSASGPMVPTWLSEGLADHVGYLGSGVPVEVAAGEVREDVLAGRLPRALPADEAFDGDNPALGEAYEQAWLVVEHLVATYGLGRVLALHRDLGARPGSDRQQALADALDDVLGLTPAQLLADWRAGLRRRLS